MDWLLTTLNRSDVVELFGTHLIDGFMKQIEIHTFMSYENATGDKIVCHPQDGLKIVRGDGGIVIQSDVNFLLKKRSNKADGQDKVTSLKPEESDASKMKESITNKELYSKLLADPLINTAVENSDKSDKSSDERMLHEIRDRYFDPPSLITSYSQLTTSVRRRVNAPWSDGDILPNNFYVNSSSSQNYFVSSTPNDQTGRTDANTSERETISAAELDGFQKVFVKSMEYFGYKENDSVNLDVFTANHLIQMQTFNIRLQDLFQLGAAPTFHQLWAMNIKGLENYERSRNALSQTTVVQQMDLTSLFIGDLLQMAQSSQLSLEEHIQMASFLNFSINDLKTTKTFRNMRLTDVDRFTTELFGFTSFNNLNLADFSLNKFFKLNIYNLSLHELLSTDLDNVNLDDLFQRDVANYKNNQASKINFNLLRGSNLAELNLLAIFLGDLFHLKNFNASVWPEMKVLNKAFDLRLRELKKLINTRSVVNVEYLKNSLGAQKSASQWEFDNFGRIPSRHRFPGRPAFYDEATNTFWDGSRGFTWNHLAQSQKEAEPEGQRSQYISKF